MAGSKGIDAVVIGNYAYTDKAMITTEGVVHNFKLSLDEYQCSYEFLEKYFKNKRDLAATKAEWDAMPAVSNSPTFLNAVYISDLLREKLAMTVHTINNFADEKARLEECLSMKPPFVLISSSLIIFPGLITEIIEFVKQIAPESIVIVGGTKIFKSYKIKQLYESGDLNDFPMEWLKRMHYFFGERKDRADYYIVNSRGESTLLKLIEAVRNGQDPKGLPNLAYYEDDELVMNEVTPEPYLLEDFCIDWSRVDEEIIGFEVPVSLKQGCPYRCNFCDFVGLERKLVNRKWEIVLKELSTLSRRFKGKSICCVDENLFLNKKHLRTFCESIIKAKLDIRWRGFTRTDVIDSETAALLKEAGCYSMALGVESGDSTILINMNKKVTAERSFEAIKALNHVGINTYSTLFMGFPGETEQTVTNTIDFLNSYPDDEPGLNFYSVNAFLVLPISPVSSAEMRRQFSLTGYYDRWEHSTMSYNEAIKNVKRLFVEVKNCHFVYLDSSENSVIDGTIPQHRAIIRDRQTLVQNRIKGTTPAEEAALWDKLEESYSQLRAGVKVGA